MFPKPLIEKNKTKIKFSLRPPGTKGNKFFNQTINGRYVSVKHFERAARAQDLGKTEVVRLFQELLDYLKTFKTI